MSALRVYLQEDEHQALLKIARAEKRDLAPQAAMLLRERLIERGLLAADVPATTPQLSEVDNVLASQFGSRIAVSDCPLLPDCDAASSRSAASTRTYDSKSKEMKHADND